MSHAQITINDEVKLDGDYNLATLAITPPEFLEDIIAQMQPNSAQKPQAYLTSIAGTFADALLREVDSFTIDVSHGPDWWTMTVKER